MAENEQKHTRIARKVPEEDLKPATTITTITSSAEYRTPGKPGRFPIVRSASPSSDTGCCGDGNRI